MVKIGEHIELNQLSKIGVVSSTIGESLPWQALMGLVEARNQVHESPAFFGQARVDYDPRVFDFMLFDHLTMGETELQREVISLFKLQVENTLAAVPGAGDLPTWIRLAHTLKGAAATVGAGRIAELAKGWECLADLLSDRDLEAAASELQVLAGQYFAEVNRVLGDDGNGPGRSGVRLLRRLHS